MTPLKLFWPRQFFYCLLQTVRGIRSAWVIQGAASIAIATCFLLVGLILLLSTNIDRLTYRFGNGVQFIVYLKSDISEAQRNRLIKVLHNHPDIHSVRYISPEEAFRRLSDQLGNKRAMLDSIDRSFLPMSLELRMVFTKSTQLQKGRQIRPLLALLESSPIVEEVDHMGRWVGQLNSIVKFIHAGVFSAAFIVCLAALFIIGSTIRLGVFSRKEEIEILQLVGATDHYIRLPFLLEGMLQGLIGSILAEGLLFIFFKNIEPLLENIFTSSIISVPISFFTPFQLSMGLLGGMFLGFSASWIALARYLKI